MINAKASIDIDQPEICLPKVLEDYKTDFGGTDEQVLQFVFRYFEEEYDFDDILRQHKNNNLLVKYE